MTSSKYLVIDRNYRKVFVGTTLKEFLAESGKFFIDSIQTGAAFIDDSEYLTIESIEEQHKNTYQVFTQDPSGDGSKTPLAMLYIDERWVISEVKALGDEKFKLIFSLDQEGLPVQVVIAISLSYEDRAYVEEGSDSPQPEAHPFDHPFFLGN